MNAKSKFGFFYALKQIHMFMLFFANLYKELQNTNEAVTTHKKENNSH